MPPTTAAYFDAALVAKFYVNEPGRDAVRRLAKRAGTVATSGIAVAEVAAAFHRKLREGAIDVPMFEALQGQFHHDVSAGTVDADRADTRAPPAGSCAVRAAGSLGVPSVPGRGPSDIGQG